MRLLVIGAGMMGSAAAYDMARSPAVQAATLADSDMGRAKNAAKRGTTAWPASVVVKMLASGEITKRGAVRSELDIPAGTFLRAMDSRGVRIEYSSRVS